LLSILPCLHIVISVRFDKLLSG